MATSEDLVLRNVSMQFKGVRAVDDFNGTFEHGKIYGLIGTNGAGKSTVINMITGSIKPTKGEILLGDVRLDKLPAYKIAGCGLARTFQNLRVFKQMTVEENIKIAEQMHHRYGFFDMLFSTGKFRNQENAMRENAKKYLDMVGITRYANQRADNLAYGHQKMLDAFEQLWQEGFEGNLVLVGRMGWKMESFAKRLEAHAEYGKRLFWLRGISDEYLDLVYQKATCLIAASEGEGFGLPLIEAAQHGIPILARDIPVFHEVAGDYAMYFDGTSVETAKQGVKDWMKAYESGTCAPSKGMPFLTWRQSAQMLADVMLRQHWWKVFGA